MIFYEPSHPPLHMTDVESFYDAFKIWANGMLSLHEANVVYVTNQDRVFLRRMLLTNTPV